MGSKSPECSYGRRLIPHLIDERSSENCQRAFCSLPRSLDLQNGFKDVSWLHMATAVNKAAWWIEREIGRSPEFESLGYIGPPDLRYPILAVAAQKTGYKAFFPSLWNNVDTHLHLLKSASCKVLITPSNPTPVVKILLAQRSMHVLKIAEMDELLSEPFGPSYPYEKTFEQAQNDPFVAVHTSGSTGSPKLVVPTHGTMAACDSFQDLPSLGYPATLVEAIKGKRVLAGLPPFHGAGLFILLAMTSFYDVTAIVGPATPLTAQVADEIHRFGNLNISILRPFVLEQIADDSDRLENLKGLDHVMNGACPLPRAVGDRIASKAPLMTFLGSTETMLLPTQYPDKNDWQYFGFSDCMGAEFRHFHENLYELVIVRNPNHEKYQSIFYTFPNLHEYSMKDLYAKHPTKSGLWTYRGRSDDVVVFTNGKKLHPSRMEELIASHPKVSSALVLGQARLKSAVLIQAKQTSRSESRAPTIEDIWPIIERANQECPEYARIARNSIMFTSPEKPMVHTGKGTVQRLSTCKEYEEEIDSLYASVDLEDKVSCIHRMEDF